MTYTSESEARASARRPSYALCVGLAWPGLYRASGPQAQALTTLLPSDNFLQLIADLPHKQASFIFQI